MSSNICFFRFRFSALVDTNKKEYVVGMTPDGEGGRGGGSVARDIERGMKPHKLQVQSEDT